MARQPKYIVQFRGRNRKFRHIEAAERFVEEIFSATGIVAGIGVEP